ncbi:MAG: hypothetical protein ACI9RM_000904 [Ulvibacter sp.]
MNSARASLSKFTNLQLLEFEDVRSLEKTSLKSMFYKVLGSKEAQIEKERQEYLEVALKYDEAKKKVDLLEYERSVLEKKVTDAKALDKKIIKLKKQREKDLMKSNPLVGQRLVQIAKGEDDLHSINREIEEAMAMGQQASHLLNQIISLLKKSDNWGQWGRGSRQVNPARYARHSSIDRAKNLAYQAQQHLRQFEIELADVYRQQNYTLKIELGSFNSFVHVLFDNLISDWVIQQKIQNAVSNVAAVRDRVTRLLGNLEADRRSTGDEIGRLLKERERLVMKA